MSSENFVASILLIFLSIDYGINGAEVALCNDLSVAMNVFTVPENKMVYAYTADVSLLLTEDNLTNVSITRQFSRPSNSSIYNQTASPWKACPIVNQDCSFITQDAYAGIPYYLMVEGKQVYFWLMSDLMFDQGTIYDACSMFDPSDPSCISVSDTPTNFDGYTLGWTYCCNKYTYFTIPDNEPIPCLDLYGISTVHDINGSVVSVVEANYETTPYGLNFTATSILLPQNGAFNITPNYHTGCSAFPNETCSLFFEDAIDNFQIDMFLWPWVPGKYQHPWGSLLTTKIIQRNGMLMQNQTHPFTTDNPCLTTSTPINYRNSHAKTSLCCTKFKQSTTINSQQQIHKNDRLKLKGKMTRKQPLDISLQQGKQF